MESTIRVQILDKAACISLHTNAFRKGMNSTIFPPAIDNQSRPDSLALVRQPLSKKNLIQNQLFHLKTDHMSHPAHVR